MKRDILRIVKGNDFALTATILQAADADGTRKPMPLSQCSVVKAALIGPIRRIPLTFTISGDTDGLLTASVHGADLHLGLYALEVKGTLLGADWRTQACEQFEVVPCDCDGTAVKSATATGLTAQFGLPGLTPKGAWQQGAAYAAGDTVSHQGGCWFANKATTDEPTADSPDWTLLMLYTPTLDDLEQTALRTLRLLQEEWARAELTLAPAATTMASLCQGSPATRIDFSQFNAAYVTSMFQAFRDAKWLEEIVFAPDFNASQCTNFASMFQGCAALKTLDLSAWDVSSGTNFSFMFYGSVALESLIGGRQGLDEAVLVGLGAKANPGGTLYLERNSSWDRPSLRAIINGLAERDGGTLTMGSQNLAKLTEDDMEIAAEKGWTLY